MGVKPLAILLILGLHLGTSLGQSTGDKSWHTLEAPVIRTFVPTTYYDGEKMTVTMLVDIKPLDYNDHMGFTGLATLDCDNPRNTKFNYVSVVNLPAPDVNPTDWSLLVGSYCLPWRKALSEWQH